VVSPTDYTEIIEEMRRYAGALSLPTREDLSRKAFQRTATYDMAIFTYLSGIDDMRAGNRTGISGMTGGASVDLNEPRSHHIEDATSPPDYAQWTIRKMSNLRYGENPHQAAALYLTGKQGGIGGAELLNGKEMSFNNYVDADAAWQLVSDFDEMACAIIKHTNPAGVALGQSAEEAYRRALATDPVSAFGGIVAFNRKVDLAAARAVVEIFTEVVIAPGYDADAIEILRTKKNLRVLRTPLPERNEGLEFKQISGGMLVQTRDTHRLTKDDLKVVTRREPAGEEVTALLFAWTVCKHTKSNAIVYARNGQTVGVGAGQMSRVDSVKIGAMRAQLPLEKSVLASDAFFPFRDGIDEAARHGITAIIQPGGSMRDAETIIAADEHNLAMVFTGIRHFKH
ncbi:MAG TPA: bifunctional phosphoribosylaminoimidazolecarboxamide formyltransferase/IMP cyclohydrolase, partial [Pyrinomonadaceae bacterium]|nr:bifunctional phosphoribosylaminoimidazolecarboxamide formyltransferase/IMP cyclohydrolase [Pyrinomonadaceae bacterium]